MPVGAYGGRLPQKGQPSRCFVFVINDHSLTTFSKDPHQNETSCLIESLNVDVFKILKKKEKVLMCLSIVCDELQFKPVLNSQTTWYQCRLRNLTTVRAGRDALTHSCPRVIKRENMRANAVRVTCNQ